MSSQQNTQASKFLSLHLRPYAEQLPEWPKWGRHIMAQFDADSIVVYQAYRAAIARYAVENRRFGGEFSYTRMSWIKPNFLWMMFRAGWATKAGQEHVLAIRLRRKFFDEILSAAVASSFEAGRFASHQEWKNALAISEVRLQWDPDHDPQGNCLPRRAVQLGLRGKMLCRFGTDEIISIEDITPFVATQRELAHGPSELLLTPVERVYLPASADAAAAVGLDSLLQTAPPPQRGGATKPGASDAGAQPPVTPMEISKP